MSYLAQTGRVAVVVVVAAAAAVAVAVAAAAVVVAAEHQAEIPVAGDPSHRDSHRASDPNPVQGDVDRAVLVLPGSLDLEVQEDHGDPWDQDHAAVALSDHVGRDFRLQSPRAKMVLLLQGPEAGSEQELAASAVEAVAEVEQAHVGAVLVVQQALEQAFVQLLQPPVVLPAWVWPHQVSGWPLLLWQLELSRPQQWQHFRPPWQHFRPHW